MDNAPKSNPSLEPQNTESWKQALDPQRLAAGVRGLQAKFQKIQKTTERLQLKRRVKSLRDYLQSMAKK
ncbi:MAG: hypothetical protein R3B54_08350 [Bdellovibrionota bacterium]